jgi:hypothetical protein
MIEKGKCQLRGNQKDLHEPIRPCVLHFSVDSEIARVTTARARLKKCRIGVIKKTKVFYL